MVASYGPVELVRLLSAYGNRESRIAYQGTLYRENKTQGWIGDSEPPSVQPWLSKVETPHIEPVGLLSAHGHTGGNPRECLG
jgi:hypothetical protein